MTIDASECSGRIMLRDSAAVSSRCPCGRAGTNTGSTSAAAGIRDIVKEELAEGVFSAMTIAASALAVTGCQSTVRVSS